MDASILVMEDSSQVHAAGAAALEGGFRPHFVETLKEACKAIEENVGAFELGVCDDIEKPFDLRELQGRNKSFLLCATP